MDKLSDSNPVTPFFDFRTQRDDGSGVVLTYDKFLQKLSDPPYVTHFTTDRKVRSFSGSRWKIDLFDPTFNLLEDLLVDFQTQNNFGYVKYSLGYVQSDGLLVQSPYVAGMVTKVLPTYTRQGVKLTLQGVDFDLHIAAQRVPMQMLTQPGIAGMYSDVASFMTAALSVNGAAVNVYYRSEALKSMLTMAHFDAFCGAGDNWSGLLVYFDAAALTSTISLSRFLRIMRAYCSEITQDASIQMVIEPNESTVSLDIMILDNTNENLNIAYADVPRFYINTTKTKDGKDNLSNVVSFAPGLDAFTPQMLGLSATQIEATDNETREQIIDSFSITDDGGGPLPGGFLLMDSTFAGADASSVNAGHDFTQNIQEFSLRTSPLQTLMAYNVDIQKRVRKQIADTFSVWPMRGALVVAYPDPGIAPWSHVGVSVAAPDGYVSVTSGIYLVQSIKYDIQPGKFTGTMIVMKSGGSMAKSADEYQPKRARKIHDTFDSGGSK